MAAFIGTTPNIGTTAAAFATAYRIAEASGESIGYLCLHLKSAKLHRYLGIDEPLVSLDKLQPELRTFSLTAEKLRRSCYSLPGMPQLQVLFGNLMRDQAEYYSPEAVEHLLTVAQQAFSFVVVDVGAYWDNAATVCSIRSAGSRILTTTSALSHFQEDGRRWIGQISPLFDVSPHQYDCVVIQQPWRSDGYRMQHISKELGMTALGSLQMKESLFGYLDAGDYEEWLKRDSNGRIAMQDSAEKLMKRHQIPVRSTPLTRQRWYRKWRINRKEAIT